MRILWHSNAAHVRTGYGVQTRLFAPRLQAAGHPVAISAFYGVAGGSLRWEGVQTYWAPEAGYGMNVVGDHSRHWKADLTITLIDAWVIDAHAFGPGVNWAPWFPIDHEPMPPAVWNAIKPAIAPICMSRNGMEQCAARGLDAYYVPHAVDTTVYRPRDKAEARAALGWPPDKQVVLMVAANKGFPCRKGFQEAMEAFAAYRANGHPDVLLYLHTTPGMDMGGVNIPAMADALGITTAVSWPDPYAYLFQGFDDEFMARLYSAADVFLNPAMGEGFGVPILEAQACGCPVIVGEWTAMGELCVNGLAIPRTEARRSFTQQNSWQYLAQPGAILAALEAVLSASPESRAEESAKGVAWAQGYDAEVVTRDYWLPTLAEIELRIGRVGRAARKLAGQEVTP